MSEVEKENEKDYLFFKIITLIIIYFIIGILVVFVIGVSKVNAQSFTNGTINIFNSYGVVNGTSCSEFPCYVDNSSNSNFGFQFILNNNTWASASFNYVIQYKVYYVYTKGMVVNLNLNDIAYYWVNGSSSTAIGSGCSTSGTQSVKEHSSTSYRKTYTLTTICSFISPPSNQTAFEIDVPVANVQYELSQWRWGVRRGEFVGADRTSKATNSITDSDRIIAQSDLNTQRIINSFNAGQQQTQESIDANTDAVNENTEKVEDINDSLNDESNADIGNIQVQTIDDTPISDLLLLPINLANIVINADSGSCVDYTIGKLFNHTLKFKCIDFENLLGSNIYHTIDIFMAFFVIYEVAKMIITAFNDVTSLRDSFDDLYTPAHEGYATKHGGGARV